MDNDKLKKLEVFCGRFNALMISGQYCERDGKIKDSDDYDYVEDILPDLIKHCRQLEKDNAGKKKEIDDLIDVNVEGMGREKQLAEANAELLAALKPFSEILEKLKKEGFDHENNDDMKKLSNFGIELALDKAMIERLKSARQTHEELRETYPKERDEQ